MQSGPSGSRRNRLRRKPLPCRQDVDRPQKRLKVLPSRRPVSSQGKSRCPGVTAPRSRGASREIDRTDSHRVIPQRNMLHPLNPKAGRSSLPSALPRMRAILSPAPLPSRLAVSVAVLPLPKEAVPGLGLTISPETRKTEHPASRACRASRFPAGRAGPTPVGRGGRPTDPRLVGVGWVTPQPRPISFTHPTKDLSQHALKKPDLAYCPPR